MKKMIVVTAALSALVFTGFAAAQPGPRGHDGEREHRRGAMALMMLGAADYDGNNTVTRAEVERLQREEFAFRDRNGDGYLDQSDASPIRQRSAAMRPEGVERPDRGGRRGAGRERIDTNGDGRVSQAEFVGRDLRVFDRFDANGDDAVSPEEIDAAIAARRDRRGERREAAQWWRD
jgi:hypothetical protein